MKTSAGHGNIYRVLHEKTVLDGQIQAGTDKTVNDSIIPTEQNTDVFEEMLDRALEQKFHEMLQELQKVLGEQISSGFREYASGFHSSAENPVDKSNEDGVVQVQETELSEDMMAFAFAMGE